MNSYNKLYNCANKIRMKLLLFIDNEIQKKSKTKKNMDEYKKTTTQNNSYQINLEETFFESYEKEFYYSFNQDNFQNCSCQIKTISYDSLKTNDISPEKCIIGEYITKKSTNLNLNKRKIHENFAKNSQIIVNKTKILSKKVKKIGFDYLLHLCHSFKLKKIHYKHLNKNKKHTHPIKKYLKLQSGKIQLPQIKISTEKIKTTKNKIVASNFKEKAKTKQKLSSFHIVSMLDKTNILYCK